MKQNPLNPYCARCSSRLKRNGTKNGKPRFRCHTCGYNETENSIAHNANKRVFPIGYAQLKKRSILLGRSQVVALTKNNTHLHEGSNTKAYMMSTKHEYVKSSGKNPNTTLERETHNTLS